MGGGRREEKKIRRKDLESKEGRTRRMLKINNKTKIKIEEGSENENDYRKTGEKVKLERKRYILERRREKEENGRISKERKGKRWMD